MSAAEQLTVETSVADDGGHVVWLAGELDMATQDVAATIMESAFRQAGTDGLIIDLSGLAFIDASGVSALVRLHNAAVVAGMRLRLRGVHGLVARVLTLCGLADIVEALAAEPSNRPGTP